MGTYIEIKAIATQSSIEVDNLLCDAINIFHQVSARYSRFEPQSEISRLNNSKVAFTCQDAEIIELLEFGIDLYKLTDGVFDISIIDFLNLYGYRANTLTLREDKDFLGDELATLLASRPKLTDISIDKKNLKITLQPNQKIDLGAYAKGFAIRQAKDMLLREGLHDFLINAGGDIYANGKNQNRKSWEIGLFDSQNSLEYSSLATKGKIGLMDESIACSGKWARKYKNFNHLINPQKGKPIDHPDVFVRAKDPMVADAFATICYLDPRFAKLDLPKYKFQKI
jgi:FAD:protein FMN transferase